MSDGSNRAAPKKAVGHEAVLSAIRREGRRVVVQMMNADEPVIGRLIAYDHYTLSVEVEGGNARVLFKHAMESFEAEPRAVV